MRLDKLLTKLRSEHPLSKRIEECWDRINHDVTKLHEVSTFFESCFPIVISPEFGKEQKMFSRTRLGGIPGYWKSKIMLMGHQRARKKLLRKMARRGHYVGCKRGLHQHDVRALPRSP